MSATDVCEAEGCERAARCAIRTTRPTRDKLLSTVFYDDRTAPATAIRYCKQHGAELAKQLIETLTHEDE